MADSSTTQASGLGKIGGRSQPRQQWHLLYYVLAMFNILTVGFTLWLNHQMQEAFGQSVEVGSAWERRLRDYGDMISIARAVQVRCNNVFITRDVVQQRDDLDVPGECSFGLRDRQARQQHRAHQQRHPTQQ
ncbi:MAG: hypothetical protein WCS99_20770 [Limisphaerales bacterium]